ncbi:MAG TPA: phosphotransferase, partial [Bryobacteraceae bacterium]|nr:phosphotransferase [Bryobacteraceae bacterium]
MTANLFAWDQTEPNEKISAPNIEELIDVVTERVGGDWNVIRSVMKLRKVLFEAEWNGRRVIGKVSKSDRAKTAYESFRAVWGCGLRPPARYTVVEPIAWIPERSLLLLEKAPGISFLDAMQTSTQAEAAARHAAVWLKAMWECDAPGPEKLFDPAAAVERAETLSLALGSALPNDLTKMIIDILAKRPTSMRPSHGDFHPMNLFVSDDRVTAIDLDTFAWQEREADIGYCLAQTANFGLMLFDSFADTEHLRSAFLEECGPVEIERVAAHMAW